MIIYLPEESYFDILYITLNFLLDSQKMSFKKLDKWIGINYPNNNQIFYIKEINNGDFLIFYSWDGTFIRVPSKHTNEIKNLLNETPEYNNFLILIKTLY